MCSMCTVRSRFCGRALRNRNDSTGTAAGRTGDDKAAVAHTFKAGTYIGYADMGTAVMRHFVRVESDTVISDNNSVVFRIFAGGNAKRSACFAEVISASSCASNR